LLFVSPSRPHTLRSGGRLNTSICNKTRTVQYFHVHMTRGDW
jgi:hypothetical protein